MSRIAIIGAGAWGTALSIVLGRSGRHDVQLWAWEKDVCNSINTERTNASFLPGHRVPEGVQATNSLPEAVSQAEIVVSAVP